MHKLEGFYGLIEWGNWGAGSTDKACVRALSTPAWRQAAI
jgi:hypothetical protein